MFVGDEYISGDNQLYRIVSVDDAARTATAERVGQAQIDEQALAAFYALADEQAAEDDGKRLVCMYSTHSDESYTPDRRHLFPLGRRRHLRRRQRAEGRAGGARHRGRLLRRNPSCRTTPTPTTARAPPPRSCSSRGRTRSWTSTATPSPPRNTRRPSTARKISKVRLFVGRSNQNADANRAFAQEIKAVADEEYPGLIKDIYIGKGNYNQELYPQALLLEFGTDEIEKDKAIGATEYMAEVLDQVLYGESAQAETERRLCPRGDGHLLGHRHRNRWRRDLRPRLHGQAERHVEQAQARPERANRRPGRQKARRRGGKVGSLSKKDCPASFKRNRPAKSPGRAVSHAADTTAGKAI